MLSGATKMRADEVLCTLQTKYRVIAWALCGRYAFASGSHG